MFTSKNRDIIIPQAEHARLSGTLAQQWGNLEFSRPSIDFHSFVLGVALHDRAFGEMDTLPIGNIPEALWVSIERNQGAFAPLSDPAAHVVILMHIKRLSSYKQTPERQQLEADIDAYIDQLCQQHGLQRKEFELGDTITDLCDSIAFDFSHEAAVTRTISVSNKLDSAKQTDVTYHIDGQGGATLTPWPFAADKIEGYIWGYDKQGYPHTQEPVLVPYLITPANTP